MGPWVAWLLVAALLGIAELLTLTFALGILAVAALAAGLTGALGLPLAAQAAVFAVGSIAGVAVVRPLAARHIRRPPRLRSGTAALVGREAYTLTEVTRRGGRARIGGEEWTARPYDPDLVIPAGATADVLAIEGATALLYPVSAEEPP
ncbi:NfeD family protein [Spirillospora sp. NPDC047418]